MSAEPIILLGFVKKNAIMMLDSALEAQKRDPSISPLQVITGGCNVRIRPIMMTAMAALMGALQIALGIGAGSDARRPLGLAVAGALCFSQLIIFYITSAYYWYLEIFSKKLKNRRLRKKSHLENKAYPECL